MKNIIVVLFDNFEALDVFGPVEIFGRMKEDFNPELFSMNGGLVESAQNFKVMTRSFSEINFEKYILFIPGGSGTRALTKNSQFLSKLKDLAVKAENVLTVCTGSILFSKTGMLDGKKATSNKRVFFWGEKETPGVNWVKKARWVKDGNIYTSSGVTAGIDMTLAFISETLGYEKAKTQSNEIEHIWNENPDNDPFAELY
jgi:putative intracellular protease/amidase